VHFSSRRDQPRPAAAIIAAPGSFALANFFILSRPPLYLLQFILAWQLRGLYKSTQPTGIECGTNDVTGIFGAL
jgi:hypothetical protein